MAQTRVLVLGDVVLDAYVYGETTRVSREAPVLVVRREREEYRLGGAANVAANLAALGVETTMLGVVGKDEAATQLRAMLSQSGVNTVDLYDGFSRTPCKTRILAGAVGTSRQQVLRMDDEPQLAHQEQTHAYLLNRLTASLQHVDAVVVSDYGLGSVPSLLIPHLQKFAQFGHRICVDSRYRLHEFTGMTAITPNLPEAEQLVGFRLDSQAMLEKAGQVILEKLKCSYCLCKQGQSGMTLFQHNEQPFHVDIVGPGEVIDVTGAGDTVLSVFSASVAAGLSLKNAVKLANCAAGIVVSKQGTATTHPQEFAAKLQQWHVGSSWDN